MEWLNTIAAYQNELELSIKNVILKNSHKYVAILFRKRLKIKNKKLK